MFNKESFIEECQAAIQQADTHAVIREIVERAVSDPSEIVRALGEPARSGVEAIYRSDQLTILNLCWGPRMKFKPHNHRMWAVIGIYGGCEQNIFYQKSESGLNQHGAKDLHAMDTVPLGAEVIHAVTNPLDQLTAAIHVYGGDFFNTPRSEWDPETFEERPYDLEGTMRAFEEANERLRGMESR